MPGHRTVAETDSPRLLRAAIRNDRVNYVLALKGQRVTQAAIAERLGLSQQRISQIIRQSRQHTPSELTDCRRNVEVVQHGEAATR